MAVAVAAGQRHESTRVEAAMGPVRVAVPVGRPGTRGTATAGPGVTSVVAGSRR